MRGRETVTSVDGAGGGETLHLSMILMEMLLLEEAMDDDDGGGGNLRNRGKRMVWLGGLQWRL